MGFHKYSQITKGNVEKKDKAAGAVQQAEKKKQPSGGSSIMVKDKEAGPSRYNSGSVTIQTAAQAGATPEDGGRVAASPDDGARSPSAPLRGGPDPKAVAGTLSPIDVSTPPHDEATASAVKVDQHQASRGRYIQRGGVDSEDERLYEELAAPKHDET